MLKVMRDSFKHLKWILILIVAAFVFMVFSDWGGGGATGAVTNQSFIARVNGEVIPISDYSRTMYLTEQQYEQAYGTALTPEMRQQLGLTQLVVNSLIDQKLLLQEAERLNLTATEKEVRDYILKMPQLSPDGQFVGEELYHRYVTGNLGYPTAAAFEEEIRQELTLAKINSALMNAVVVPPARAEEEFRRRNESSRIQYVLFPADRALAGVQVAPAEVEKYYRENTGRYTHPEQRNVTYLLADLSRVRSQITIPETELRAQYASARDTYRSPEAVSAQHVLITVDQSATPEQDAAALSEAREVLAKARSGEDFASLVALHSDEPGAAERAGDLGFFSRGRMVAPFEQAAFAMQPGEISEPVRTQFGYHIIKVNDRRAESILPFEDVRTQLESRLIEERTKTDAREAINQARVRLEQLKPLTPEDLQSVTGQIVTYNDGSWFGKTEPLAGIGRAPAINDWAFDEAKVGETSPIVDTPRGPAVAYLQGERPAGVSPLVEIRPRVENEAKMAKAREAARGQLEAAHSSGGSLEAAAASLNLTPQEATVTRATSVTGLSGSSQDLITAAIQAETGQTAGPVVVDDGAVLFTVLEQKRYDPAQFAAQKDTLIESIRQNEFRNLRASLIASMREDADLVLNDQLINAEMGVPVAAGM